jgi:hypothetical protein
LTAAQRFLKKKAEKAAQDSPEEDRYREPTKKHVRDANWKEYAISRTTGKPGAKPRLVRGGGKSDTQKTLDKIERKTEEYSLDEAKMGEILRNTKKGTAPYTIVAHKAGRVVGQEHTKTVQAVPAFVREIQKKYPNAKISVEDRRGRVLHTEENIEEMMIDELTPAQKAAKEKYVQSKGGRAHGGRAGKRNSRQIRRKSTSPGSHERGPGKPPRDIDIWALGKKNADWEPGKILAKKKRGLKIEREIEEMQSGSKKSKVEKTGTHSSNLSYVSGSKHAVGRSSKKEKKRASKEARQARKRRGFGESSVSITPEREAEIKKEVQAEIEKDRQAKKARDKKDGRYMDHWGNWRTKGKPNPADILRNGDEIDWDAHAKRRRVWNKLDKAAQRTAKTKRSFGPNKPSKTAIRIAMDRARARKK